MSSTELMNIITHEELSQYALDSENEAAKKIGCGTTRFKAICRSMGIERWSHRKLNSLLTMYRSLASYYKESCEKTLMEADERVQAINVEVVKAARADLVHLRQYALKVETNLLLLNPYHNARKPWPADILRIRSTIYKQRHVRANAGRKSSSTLPLLRSSSLKHKKAIKLMQKRKSKIEDEGKSLTTLMDAETNARSLTLFDDDVRNLQNTTTTPDAKFVHDINNNNNNNEETTDSYNYENFASNKKSTKNFSAEEDDDSNSYISDYTFENPLLFLDFAPPTFEGDKELVYKVEINERERERRNYLRETLQSVVENN